MLTISVDLGLNVNYLSRRKIESSPTDNLDTLPEYQINEERSTGKLNAKFPFATHRNLHRYSSTSLEIGAEFSVVMIVYS